MEEKGKAEKTDIIRTGRKKVKRRDEMYTAYIKHLKTGPAPETTG